MDILNKISDLTSKIHNPMSMLNPMKMVEENLPFLEIIIYDELQKLEDETGEPHIIIINKLKLKDGTKKVIVSVGYAEREDNTYLKLNTRAETTTTKGIINFIKDILQKFTN